MQQEANRKLGFSSNRTMKTAQELYEGIDVAGEGAMGLITYMRTDSLRISDEARSAGNTYILENYGADYLPAKSRIFKTKNTAQDAHEAIRPSVPSLTPEKVKNSLSNDQYRLYKLIWERFIASLMADQQQKTNQVDITAGDYVFKASGYTVEFDGYTVLYVEGKDEKEDENRPLPVIKEGDTFFDREVKANQHFTQPPARYTEATLNKAMEENGIGRPSTYAPTISTILSREYIEREGKTLKPTALGEVVTSLMKEKFPQIVDMEFTANMEKQLDEVENGENDWVTTLDGFYISFRATLEAAESSLSGERIKVPEIETDVVCELCGKKMVVKSGRYGKFLACPGYPTCKNTRQIVEETTGVCPTCGGTIISKKSRHNRKFFGCSNYPNCTFMSWDEPSHEKCPKCGKTLFKRKNKNGDLYCQTPDCGYEKK
jgi:DNA topoisomerase-1